MRYPKWTPKELIDEITRYDEAPTLGQVNADFVCICRLLATRPEMESIWPWLLQTGIRDPWAPDGFLATLWESLAAFDASPKLSTTRYEKAMNEIAKTASILVDQLKKFEDATWFNQNPFEHLHFQHWEFSKRLAALTKRDMTEGSELVRTDLYYSTVANFPGISEHLHLLIDAATTESISQRFRMTVSKKSKDFRTYFIRAVAHHIRSNHDEGEYSPSKVATICSVALDDADITSDLVRKLV